MMSIPAGIITNLREELLRCGPFSSRDALVPLFVDNRIYPWRNHVPNAPNPVALVDALIEHLHDHYNNKEENALVLFVQTLSERQPPGNNCGPALAQLAHTLAVVLTPQPDVIPPTPEWGIIDATGGGHHFAHVLLGEFIQISDTEEEKKRVERIVNYAVRLARERQGQGTDLTQAEWTLLVATIWLRVYKG